MVDNETIAQLSIAEMDAPHEAPLLFAFSRVV